MTLDRQSPRRAADRILSIEMGSSNHAIVLNISNEGLGFHAINPLAQSGTIHFSFLDGAQRVEASGELVWIDAAKKNGGLRFDSLPQPTRERIQSWAAPIPAAAAEAASTNVAPAAPFQTKASPSSDAAQGLNAAPTQASVPPPPYVPAPNAPTNPRFAPLEENQQSAPHFWYQAPEYTEYQEGQASGSRGKFFRGFVSGAIVVAILAAGLFVAGDNPVPRLLAEAKTTIFGAPAPRPQQDTAAPAPQPSIPQDAIPPPLVSSGLPPVGGPAEPTSSAPLPESAGNFNPGDVAARGNAAARTSPKPPVVRDATNASNRTSVGDGVDGGKLKSAPENPAAESDDSGDEDLALAQKYLSAKAGPATNAAAVQLLWAAVGKGNVTAEFTLADLYARGDGVAKSCDQARLLVGAAEGKSSSDASQELGELIRKGCR